MAKSIQYTALADKPLPSTEQLERQVLVDAAYNQDAIGDIVPVIDATMFDVQRAKIWAELISAYEAGTRVSPTAFYQLDAAEGRELVNYSPGTYIDMVGNAKRLHDAAARKRLYFHLVDALNVATDGHATEEDVLELTEAINRQMTEGAAADTTVTMSDAVDEWKAYQQERRALMDHGSSEEVRTGFPILDTYLKGGFSAGQLVIIAARPSVGKTAFMLQFARQAATDGKPSIVFSLETPARDLAGRMVYAANAASAKDVMLCTITWPYFDSLIKETKGMPIYVDDRSRSLDAIVSKITRAVKAGKVQVAFIDYLGLIGVRGGSDNKAQQIGQVTGALKQLAMTLRIPIVLLAQLNRESAKDRDREGNPRSPELYDLRDSGAIEQDADTVLMLESNATGGTITVWLRKNRNGERDRCVVCTYNDTYSVFTELGGINP